MIDQTQTQPQTQTAKQNLETIERNTANAENALREMETRLAILLKTLTWPIATGAISDFIFLNAEIALTRAYVDTTRADAMRELNDRRVVEMVTECEALNAESQRLNERQQYAMRAFRDEQSRPIPNQATHDKAREALEMVNRELGETHERLRLLEVERRARAGA